jgi:hypothetical protein
MRFPLDRGSAPAGRRMARTPPTPRTTRRQIAAGSQTLADTPRLPPATALWREVPGTGHWTIGRSLTRGAKGAVAGGGILFPHRGHRGMRSAPSSLRGTRSLAAQDGQVNLTGMADPRGRKEGRCRDTLGCVKPFPRHAGYSGSLGRGSRFPHKQMTCRPRGKPALAKDWRKRKPASPLTGPLLCGSAPGPVRSWPSPAAQQRKWAWRESSGEVLGLARLAAFSRSPPCPRHRNCTPGQPKLDMPERY